MNDWMNEWVMKENRMNEWMNEQEGKTICVIWYRILENRGERWDDDDDSTSLTLRSNNELIGYDCFGSSKFNITNFV